MTETLHIVIIGPGVGLYDIVLSIDSVVISSRRIQAIMCFWFVLRCLLGLGLFIVVGFGLELLILDLFFVFIIAKSGY